MSDFTNYEFDSELSFSETQTRTCPTMGYQKISVCVPVTVKPFAHAGDATIKCCGKPVVVSGESCCRGKKDDVCTFTISQTLCVEVPVTFGAQTNVGGTYVDYLNASADDICKNCNSQKCHEAENITSLTEKCE